MWPNYVLTLVKKLLYKLGDEINAVEDPGVLGRPVHPKIGEMNFWRPPSLYPIFNFEFVHTFRYISLWSPLPTSKYASVPAN